MPSSVTVTVYLGSGREGMELEEKIQAEASRRKLSVSEWVVEQIKKELKGGTKR